MSVKVEKLENNMAKMTIEVEPKLLDKAIDRAYKRMRNQISIPGFRKGKAPRKLVEKMYGAEMFYEDAANFLIQDEYPKAYDESGLDIVSQPDIDVEQIEVGKPFIFTAEVATKPPVELGNYTGVQVTRGNTEATDEDVDKAIAEEQNRNARNVKVDGPAEQGDTVLIDYEGFCDGEAFEGGKAENHQLELGSNSFIPGFEDQLIDSEAGDDVEVNVTFPEEYHAPDLAGKDATFIVKVHEVRRKVLPELNEEYVEDEGFDSIEEYRDDVRQKIVEKKTAEVRRLQEDEAIAKIVEDSKIEIPDAMLQTQVNNMINEYANRVMQSGIAFNQYLQMTGMTVDKLRSQMTPEAEQRIRSSLVLEQIAKNENLEATDEDVDAKYQETADMYGMDVEELKKNLQEGEADGLREQIAVEKAIDFIMERVEEVEETNDESANGEEAGGEDE